MPGIYIDKIITINRNGHTIDASSKKILFCIDDATKVKLNNIVFKGFVPEDSGMTGLAGYNYTIDGIGFDKIIITNLKIAHQDSLQTIKK